MDVRRSLIFALPLLVALGCRTSDPSVALLESELRWVEDQYYALEDAYQQKCRELESCRMANQALRKDLAAPSTRTPTRSVTPRDLTPPRVEMNSGSSNEETFSPPMVEGIPALPRSTPPSARETPVAPSFDDLPDDLPADLSEPTLDLPIPSVNPTPPDLSPIGPALDASGATMPLPEDAKIKEIVLNRQLTGGYDYDGQVGHEGLLIVIEPRNASGQYVPLAGPVTLEVIDPSLENDRNPIAKWDLSRNDAGQHLRRTLLGRGIHLELPWPHEPPQNEKLRLAVKYTTADGRKLTAERDLFIKPPAPTSARWTPVTDPAARTARRNSRTAEPTPAIRPEGMRSILSPVEAPPPQPERVALPEWQPFR